MPNDLTTEGKAIDALQAASRHRAEAIGLGFSPEAAEAMAVSLHSIMLAELLDEEETIPPPSLYGRSKGE